MKKNSFRSNLAKCLVLVLFTVFSVGAIGSVVEFHKADNTTGIEQVYHTNEGYRFSVISLAALLIPATAALRMSGTIGFQWTRTEETLINYLKGDKASGDVAAKYATGQLRFRDRILYRAILADGFTGIQKVWDSTVSKSVGVTNVDRAKLDKDEVFCFDTILVGYVNSGGAGTDPSALAGYDYVLTSWPAALRNAEITILQDNNILLEDLPVAACGSQADSTFGLGRAEGYLLKNPQILEGDKNFEVRINFPGTISVANTDFIRVDLYGMATRKRGMV